MQTHRRKNRFGNSASATGAQEPDDNGKSRRTSRPAVLVTLAATLILTVIIFMSTKDHLGFPLSEVRIRGSRMFNGPVASRRGAAVDGEPASPLVVKETAPPCPVCETPEPCPKPEPVLLAPERPMRKWDYLSEASTNNGFPKILHQTWKSHSIPPLLRFYSLNCQQVNSDYEYFMWTDNDIYEFVSEEFPWFLPVFDSYRKPLQRADAARYFILYKFGGWYTDLDTECKEPFDSLVENLGENTEIVLSTEPDEHSAWHYGGKRILNNAVMGSKKGHYFWKTFAAYLPHFQHADDGAYLDVPVFSTGPVALTNFFQDFKEAHKSVSSVSILPSRILLPLIDSPVDKWLPCDSQHAPGAITCHRWIHTNENGLEDGIPEEVMETLRKWVEENEESLFYEEDDDCLGWRQTSGCSPNGEREILEDKPCSYSITDGLSGYCQCKDLQFKVGCFHGTFTCSQVCRGDIGYKEVFAEQ